MKGNLRWLGLILGIWAFAGVFAWLAVLNIPRATCDPTGVSHDYDLVVTHVGADGGDASLRTVEMAIRVSGEDFHMVIYPDDEEREEEYVARDGEHYQKRPGEEWKSREPGPTNIGFIWWLMDNRSYYLGLPSEHVLCAIEGENFRLGPLQFEKTLGPESVWGSDWQSYDFIAPAVAVEVPTTEASWRYWSTIKGHIYRSHQEFKWGDEEWERVEITTDIYDVGDPNVITAPELPQ